jgi:cytochrome c5
MSRVRWTAAAALALWTCSAAACAARQNPRPVSRTAEAESLPDAPGKRVLQASCTTCHDLGEVTKFRGYYDRAQWRDIVVTMVEYGAKLEKNDIEVLSDYLVQHLGRK